MANDLQKRNLLDQLTDSATAIPSVPPVLSPAVSGDTTAPTPLLPPLSSAPTTVPGSTANLESRAASPDTLANNIASTKQDQENEKDQNPGFLKKLARLAGGAVGFEDPNSSPQANLGSRIGSTVGRVGASLALAAGTPEQKQLAEEQLQMPMKVAQIQNEMQYRNGLLGVRNAANENAANKTALQFGPEGTSRMTAEAAQQNADSNEALRAAHQHQIEASLNGQVYVMPELGQMIGRPDLAGQSISPIRYQQEVANVLKSLGAKTVDLGENGVWGASPLTGRITRLGDSPAVARSNSMLLRTQLPVNDAQGNIIGWANPQTNSFTPVGSIHAKGTGAPLSENLGGDVIPPKPTSSVLSRGQVAQTILPQVPVMKQEVAALADKIGPGAGRWNQFWVNKGGINDPEFAGLNQDLQLYATALGMAHFGASMPEGFVNDMMRDFGTAQSPEDLQARIDHAEGWIRGYAEHIGGGNRAPKKGTTVPNSSTGPLSLKEAQDYLQKAGGDAAKARALAKKDGRSF